MSTGLTCQPTKHIGNQLLDLQYPLLGVIIESSSGARVPSYQSAEFRITVVFALSTFIESATHVGQANVQYAGWNLSQARAVFCFID